MPFVFARKLVRNFFLTFLRKDSSEPMTPKKKSVTQWITQLSLLFLKCKSGFLSLELQQTSQPFSVFSVLFSVSSVPSQQQQVQQEHKSRPSWLKVFRK